MTAASLQPVKRALLAAADHLSAALIALWAFAVIAMFGAYDQPIWLRAAVILGGLVAIVVAVNVARGHLPPNPGRGILEDSPTFYDPERDR